jgi:predicted amidohydrolase
MALVLGVRAEEVSLEKNLVQNPSFEEIDSSTGLPKDWRTWSPREEIAPKFEIDSKVAHSGKQSVKTTLSKYADFGHWVTTVSVLNPNRDYVIKCHFRTQNISNVHDSVWIKLAWKDKGGKLFTKEYVNHVEKDGDWYCAQEVTSGQGKGTTLDIELLAKWAEQGTVWWDDVSLVEAPTPKKVKARVATVFLVPPSPSTPEKNVQLFCEQVEQAGKTGADLVVLGEAITLVSTGKKAHEVAEPVPGPTTTAVGKLAAQYKMHIVVGLYERLGAAIYNSGVLIGRDGKVIGTYHKTHLPEIEGEWGLTPGSTYPVFETDIGKIGIEICYDNFFPEVARALAVNGAQIIVNPIWGDGRADYYNWDIVARARAIDNAVYFIASNYSNKRSLIIDPRGYIIADTAGRTGVALSDIEIPNDVLTPGLSIGGQGKWRTLYPKERRQGTYDVLGR